MSSATSKPVGVRLLACISEKMATDPVARGNLSGLVRLAVDHFIDSRLPIEPTRALGFRLSSKVGEKTTPVSVPGGSLRAYKAYVKAAGGHSFAALVNSALANRYFPQEAPVAAQPPAQEADQPPLSAGWATVLQGMLPGQVRVFSRRDGIKHPLTARNVAINSARLLRTTMPSLQVTTRVQGSKLEVTRTA